MSRDLQRLTDYLGHVLQAIDRIERYAGSIGEDEFLRSELIQDAVIRNLEVVGEASRNIDVHFPEFAASHPELPLAVAYQMRNSISHGYFKVDLGIVRRTVVRRPSMTTRELPTRPCTRTRRRHRRCSSSRAQWRTTPVWA